VTLGDLAPSHRSHGSPPSRGTRAPLVTQRNHLGVPRTDPSRLCCTIRDVTATLPLAATDDAFAAADGGPVRRSRAERQAIVLDTAERLFAGRSSRSVGMDELVRETGLGKMTVYRLFKSKDDLVGAYLSRKAATVLAFIDAELVRLEGDPKAALLSVVEAVERDVTRTGFRGCPFNNVSSEYDDPQHPARSAAADYKFELYSRLERLSDEIVPGHGEDLAAQIHLIIDGMYLSGGLLGPDGPAAHGRKLAERLIAIALSKS
jgi:AcrR family transcriptional regulator